MPKSPTPAHERARSVCVPYAYKETSFQTIAAKKKHSDLKQTLTSWDQSVGKTCAKGLQVCHGRFQNLLESVGGGRN